MSEPQREVAALDRDDLAALLGEPVADVACRPSGDRSTHSLECGRAVLEDGREIDLILKGMRPSRARGDFVRPRLVRDERREAWAYESLLAPDVLDTPRFYGVLGSRERGGRLVLEAVPGRPLSENGDRTAWIASARWLAAFHVWGDEHLIDGDPEAELLSQTPALHTRWLRRAVRRARVEGRDDVAERLHAITPAHELAVSRLAATPRGLVHGEFYPSNILVQRLTGGWRVCAIDWESVGVGPAVLDLAALTTGNWTSADRAVLWTAYEEAAGLSVGDLSAGLHAARLVNAMQWLGWSAGWRPPVEHARDWLAEAEDAARHVVETACDGGAPEHKLSPTCKD